MASWNGGTATLVASRLYAMWRQVRCGQRVQG